MQSSVQNITTLRYLLDLCEPFSRMQTSTDLTATKLFSRNREGMFQRDDTRAHTLCLKKGTPMLSIVTLKRINGF